MTEAACAADCRATVAELTDSCKKSFLDLLECQGELSCDNDDFSCFAEALKALSDCDDQIDGDTTS